MTQSAKKIETKESSKKVFKIISKHIDYLVNHLDLEKHEALRLLREHEGDFEKALEQYVLGKDSIGSPEFAL